MLFEPIDGFESSPIEFDVKANLDTSEFDLGLSALESSVETSPALADRRVTIDATVNLNDLAARAKIHSLKQQIESEIKIATSSTLRVDAKDINSTVAQQNGIFTKNLERILRDANKESFLSRIGSVITAPVRALTASTTQILKGSLFSIGEAAIKPIEGRLASKLAPITQFVGNRTANAIDSAGSFVRSRTGMGDADSRKTLEYAGKKIDSIFDANNIYNSIKSGIGYVGKLEYETRSKSSVTDKFDAAKVTVLEDVRKKFNDTFTSLYDLAMKSSDADGELKELSKELVSFNRVLLTTAGIIPDLIREFRFHELVSKTRQRKSELSYNLDSSKPTTVFVGGFAHQAGREGELHATNIKTAVDNNVIAIRNKGSDPDGNSGIISNSLRGLAKLSNNNYIESVVGYFSSILEKNIQNALKGFDSDEIEIAAHALYANELNSDSNVVAYCGGNFVAKGAAEVLHRGFNSQIPVRGFANASFDVVRPRTNNYQASILSQDPYSKISSILGNKFNLIDSGDKIDFQKHGINSYLFNENSFQHTGLKPKVSEQDFLKYSHVKLSQDGKKTNDTVTSSIANFQRSLADVTNKDALLNSSKTLLDRLKSTYNKIFNNIQRGNNVSDFEQSVVTLYTLVNNLTRELNNDSIELKDAIAKLKDNSIAIFAAAGSTGTIKPQPLTDLSEAQKRAKGATNLQYATVLQQQPVNTLLGLQPNKAQINSQLAPITVRNMEANYLNEQNRAHETYNKTTVETNPLIADFVKYGSQFSQRFWNEVYHIIAGRMLKEGASVQEVQNIFTNLNKETRKATNNVIDFYVSLKRLETAMVGTLADQYRQQIQVSANKSLALSTGLLDTEFKKLQQRLYTYVTGHQFRPPIVAKGEFGGETYKHQPLGVAPITRAMLNPQFILQGVQTVYSDAANALESVDRKATPYKILLERAAVALLTKAINNYEELSKVEKALFDRFKPLYVAKFGLQAAAIGTATGGLGAAQGAAAMSGVAAPLEGILSAIPIIGQALSHGLVESATVAGEVLGSAVVDSIAAAAVNLSVDPLVEKSVQFSAQHQPVEALPGSTKEFNKKIKAEHDDFLRSVFNTKDTNELVKLLNDFTNIPASKMYQILNHLRVPDVSSKLNKTQSLNKLKELPVELDELQKAVAIVYYANTQLTREQRKAITENFNKFVSTVRAERDSLITSNLSDEDVIGKLKNLQSEIEEFAILNPINPQQKASLRGLNQNISERIEWVQNAPSDEAKVTVQPLNLESIKDTTERPVVNVEPIIKANNTEAQRKAKETGRRISEGISEGIKNGSPDALRDILDLARAIVLVAQEELEIRSPSKKTERKIGNPIVQGIGRGITSLKSWLKSQIGLTLDDAIPDPLRFKKQLENATKVNEDFLKTDFWGTPVEPNAHIKAIKNRKLMALNQGVAKTLRPDVPDPYMDQRRERIKNQQLEERSNEIVHFAKVKQRQDVASAFNKGRDLGLSAIKSVETAYSKVNQVVDRTTEAVKRFINGNNKTQLNSSYVKGLASSWNDAKEKLGSYLQQFQLFGVSGQDILGLGVGAVGLFAFAKGIEQIVKNFEDLIFVSQQYSRIDYLFKSAFENPDQKFQEISATANRVGIKRQPLLQSAGELGVGLSVLGYSDERRSDLIKNLQKVAIGRRFSEDETSRLFKTIVQVASKDKFSAEEIFQQLADTGIYGAPKLAAIATGYGNNVAAFSKAMSQGEITANNGNLERFVQVMANVLGSDQELDPLVAATARLTNNLQDLTLASAEASKPFVSFADPLLNGAIVLLKDNLSVLGNVMLSIGVISFAATIKSLWGLIVATKAFSAVQTAFQASGLKGVAGFAFSKLAIPIAALAAVNSAISAYNKYYYSVDKVTESLRRFTAEQNKLTPSKLTSEFNPLINALGAVGDNLRALLSFDIPGMVDASIKGILSINDELSGTKTSINPFATKGKDFKASPILGDLGRILPGLMGDNYVGSSQQIANSKIRDNVLKEINKNKPNLEQAKVVAQQKISGQVIDPLTLQQSESFISGYKKELEQLPEVIKKNSPEIKKLISDLTALENQFNSSSVQVRNLALEIRNLEISIDKNKLSTAKNTFNSEIRKSFVNPLSTRTVSKIDYDEDLGNLNSQIKLQDELNSKYQEILKSADYQNLKNSTVPEQQQRALDYENKALNAELELVNLQTNKQKRINERRKELLTQSKEDLTLNQQFRRIKSDIFSTLDRVNFISNARENNISSTRREYREGQVNLQIDDILKDNENKKLEISENRKAHEDGLISFNEYQQEFLRLRNEQAELEVRYNEALTELTNIDRERQVVLLDLKQKQLDYETTIKNSAFDFSTSVINAYKNVLDETRNLVTSINELQVSSVNSFSDLIVNKFSSIKSVLTATNPLKGQDYAIKSYVQTLERLSGIRINRSSLTNTADEEIKAKLIYQLEFAKVNLSIRSALLKKDSLVQELSIQKELLRIEHEKAMFASQMNVSKAQVGLQKARIGGDENEIKMAGLELFGALSQQKALANQQNIEKQSRDQLDNIKINQSSVDLAKLSLDIKGGLINNENIKPFNDVDPLRNLARFVERNLGQYEVQVGMQRREIAPPRPQMANPVLNITNNFAGVQNDNAEAIGRQVGEQTLEALKRFSATF